MNDEQKRRRQVVDPSQRTFQVDARHYEEWDEGWCEADGPNGEVEGEPPYSVVIYNRRTICDDDEVQYQIDDGDKTTLPLNDSITVTRERGDHDVVVKLWFADCPDWVPWGNREGRPESSPPRRPERPETPDPTAPRVTLTLTKKGGY